MCTKDYVYDMYICMCVRRQAGIHVLYHVCMCVCVYYMWFFSYSMHLDKTSRFNKQSVFKVRHLRHEKKNLLLSINYTGCLIGILIHVYDGLW